jgi:hypothetical protein
MAVSGSKIMIRRYLLVVAIEVLLPHSKVETAIAHHELKIEIFLTECIQRSSTSNTVSDDSYGSIVLPFDPSPVLATIFSTDDTPLGRRWQQHRNWKKPLGS